MSKVAVSMKGSLEPIILEQDYNETITNLNTAAASGKILALMNGEDDTNIALAISNILTLTELEGEWDSGVA